MQLSRSSLLEIRLATRGRAIHNGTIERDEAAVDAELSGTGTVKPGLAFSWRRRVNGECVDAALEFGCERFIHHAVALDPGLPSEGLRHDMNAEMGLAAFPVAGVPLVLVGFVDHVEA